MPGPLGTASNSPVVDSGTLCVQQSKPPGIICATRNVPLVLTVQTRKLAAIAFGEASTGNDAQEVGGIAFAVVNRARAWGGKTVEQLLAADPNYTYAASDGNARYAKLMRATDAEIENDLGMKTAVAKARAALDRVGPDPSNGAYWWDGVDFQTNYENHPKVKDGFRFGDPAHNIFDVKEQARDVVEHWLVKNKAGQVVEGKERGRYSCVWVSTAAHGKTIFWAHDPDYLAATGCKPYR